MISLESRLESFPPCVCRMLARTGNNGKNTRLLEDSELAESSGLPVDVIRSYTWLTSWDTIPTRNMLAFAKACGFDWTNGKVMAKQEKYISNPRPMQYLRKHPKWEEFWSLVYHMYEVHVREKYAEFIPESPAVSRS